MPFRGGRAAYWYILMSIRAGRAAFLSPVSFREVELRSGALGVIQGGRAAY